MKLSLRWAVLIAAAYLAAAAIWILVSDTLVGSFSSSPEELTRIQTDKGWLFVAVSGLSLFSVLLLVFRRHERIEQELRAERRKFQDLVEKSLVGVYAIQEGKFSYVNPKCAEIYGYTQKEMIALPSVLDAVSEGSRTLVAENLRRRLEGESASLNYEFQGRRKDGTPVDVEVIGSATIIDGKPAILGTLLDVSQRKAAEETLRKSQAQLRAVFDNAAIGIAVTDLGGKILECNRTLTEMLGYSLQELQGKTFAELTHPEDRQTSLDRIRELAAGTVQQYQLEKRYVRKNGSTLWVRINVSLVRDSAGKPHLTVGMVEDITQRKNLEEQFLQAQKMEVVGRLAASVAHDFNNVLTGIGGYAQLLLQRFDATSDVGRDLMEIYALVNRAEGLTRQLLTFSRKQAVEKRVLNLNAVMEGLFKVLRKLVGENIELQFIPDRDLGNVEGDPGQLEQVLMNLVVNARDALPHGGVIAMETGNVTLSRDYAEEHFEVEPGAYVVFSVSDNGTGMDAETRRRIFEPFFTTKKEGKGTGLGLSTVYAIVKQHDGHIWVYSELGKGTTFKIYLPRVAGEREKVEAAATAKRSLPEGSETILLVEDERAVLTLARRVLTGLGYKVLSSQSPEEAEHLFRNQQARIDLLVTDIVLPGKSGLELFQELSAKQPSLKVLYMSGYTDHGILKGVLRAEVAYLQKPFGPEDLARKVRETLDT